MRQQRLLLRKGGNADDRAGAALADLQRRAYAMGILRSRIESRINSIVNAGSSQPGAEELGRTLAIVKSGETILKDLAEKAESARFLKDFFMIIAGATESASLLQAEVEQLVPAAEAALAEMHESIQRISKAMSAGSDEIDPAILAQFELEVAPSAAKQADPSPKKDEEPQEVLEPVAI